MVSATDRQQLAAIVADRNAPQKHVWRAHIVLLTADGCGTAEIMRRAGTSKTAVWRWQERLLTAYAAYALLKRPVTIRSGGKLVDACVGFLGGITGGLAGFPGATVTIWCGMRGWDKRRQRGIYQPFILIMQVLALLLIQIMRPSVTRSVGPSLVPLEFVPVALLGTWFGLAIFRRLSDRTFTLAVNLLLLGSGFGLLV